MIDDERILNATDEERERMKEPGGLLWWANKARNNPVPGSVDELTDMMRSASNRRENADLN